MHRLEMDSFRFDLLQLVTMRCNAILVVSDPNGCIAGQLEQLESLISALASESSQWVRMNEEKLCRLPVAASASCLRWSDTNTNNFGMDSFPFHSEHSARICNLLLFICCSLSGAYLLSICWVSTEYLLSICWVSVGYLLRIWRVCLA